MSKLVTVRLEGKDYCIPHRDRGDRNLMRITDHPLRPGRLLVWRQKRFAPFKNIIKREIIPYEATKNGNRIIEKRSAALLSYALRGANAVVWHFKAEPEFQGKRIGTMLADMLVDELHKARRIKTVFLPETVNEKFASSCGFERVELKEVRNVHNLDVAWVGYKADMKNLSKRAWWRSRYEHGSVLGQAVKKGPTTLWRMHPHYK
jgi:GNAT superfamily N-acetyltransferase